MYPDGHVQMALPLTGLVSQLEPSLQGLLMQASSRWHSKPGQQKAGARQRWRAHKSPCTEISARSQGTCRGAATLHGEQGARWDGASPVRPWGHSQ